MGKSCLTNLTTSYNKMPGFVDERTAVAIANFGFSKAFNIVSCKMLTEKLMKDELDKQAVRWTEDCSKSQAQKAVISGTQSANLYPRGQDWVWSCLTPSLMV